MQACFLACGGYLTQLQSVYKRVCVCVVSSTETHAKNSLLLLIQKAKLYIVSTAHTSRPLHSMSWSATTKRKRSGAKLRQFSVPTPVITFPCQYMCYTLIYRSKSSKETTEEFYFFDKWYGSQRHTKLVCFIQLNYFPHRESKSNFWDIRST